MKTQAVAQRDVYEIKIVPEKAMDQAEDLWSFAFSPTWVRHHWVKEMSTVYGAFLGKELHATLAVIDMQMNVAGRSVMSWYRRCSYHARTKISASGSAAIFTLPERFARPQGAGERTASVFLPVLREDGLCDDAPSL